MYALTIDQHRCLGCRECERLLPEFLTRAIDGILLISEHNSLADYPAIWQAVADCAPQALSLRHWP